MPNQAPVVDQVFISTREDGSLLLSQAALLAYATDADLDPLNIAYIHTAHGDLVDNLDGTWTFDPPANFTGDLELTFGVNDGTDTVEQTISLSITPENDAPTVPEVTLGMLEDGSLLISKQMLLANAHDIDGDILNVTDVASSSGSIHYAGNDMWVFSPSANFNGSLDLVFTVSDGVNEVEQDLHVNVTAVNDAPNVETASLSMGEDGTITFSIEDLLIAANASDVDDDILTVTNVSAASGTLVDNLDGTWSYTPSSNMHGVANLSFTVSDGITDVTKDLHINISAVNDDPTASDVNLSMDEDGILLFRDADLLSGATDIDGDALSISSISANSSQGTLYSSGNGVYTFVPNANFHGTADISFNVYDGHEYVTKTLNIDVASINDAPVVDAPTAVNTNENTAIVITAAQLLANASDVDGQTLSITAVTADHGNIVDNGDGTWTYTPNNYFSGATNLHYTVSDGITSVAQDLSITVNDTITQHIRFEVNNQNTGAPNYDDTSTNYYLGTPSSFPYITTVLGSTMATPNISNNVRLNESFTNADTAYLSVNQGTVRNGHALSDTNGTVTLDKFIRSDVDLGGTGNSTVTITNSSRGDINTGSGADTINITAKNTTDSYSNIFTVNSGIGNDTISLSGGTNTVFNVYAENGADNVTLSGNYASSNIFAGNGNDTITGGNSADNIDGGAGNDTINTGSGNDVIFGGVGNDTIDGGANTDKVVFSGDLNQYQFSYNATTTKFTFTDLVSGRDGTDNIKNVENFQFDNGTYTAANIQSMISSGINHAPIVVSPTAFSASEDGSVAITKAALLAGATDADGNTLTVTSVTVPSAQGSITGSDPWTFVPAADFNGAATLTFVVSDGTATATQVATVNVSAVNDAPTAAAISGLSTTEEHGILITNAQLLAHTGDIDGDNLSVSSLTVPAHEGTLSYNANGTWTFAPAIDFVGTATLTYIVTDGSLTAENTLTVDVTNINDAPVLDAVTLNVLEDHTLTINPNDILAHVSDIDNSSLSIIDISASSGTLVHNIDDTWSYTPPANFNGLADLHYTISDGTTTRVQSLYVNVEAVNDASVVDTFGLNMLENTGLIITAADILAHVSDVDNDLFDITELSVSQGTISYNDNGSWTFVPDANFVGDVDLEFTINDGANAVTQHATINVAQDIDDLKFNVNNNLNIVNPHYYDTDYTHYDANGAQVSANYHTADSASIVMQAEDSSGDSTINVTANHAANVEISHFDAVNANIGQTVGSGDSELDILYVARGNIYTGDGNDAINLSTSHTADLGSTANANLININTSSGADELNILGNLDNDQTIFNINLGSGNDSLTLEGKYAHANIIGGEGDDTVVGGDGNDLYIFGVGQGNDTFDGGAGLNWADSVMIASNGEVGVTQTGTNAWTLVVDGQEATLTTNVTGTVVDNRIDFAGSAAGTLTMHDGSSVDFNNIEHVQW